MPVAEELAIARVVGGDGWQGSVAEACIGVLGLPLFAVVAGPD